MASLGSGGLGFRLYPALAGKSQGIPSFGRCPKYNSLNPVQIEFETTVYQPVTTDIRFFALKSKKEKVLDRGQNGKCEDNNNNNNWLLRLPIVCGPSFS